MRLKISPTLVMLIVVVLIVHSTMLFVFFTLMKASSGPTETSSAVQTQSTEIEKNTTTEIHYCPRDFEAKGRLDFNISQEDKEWTLETIAAKNSDVMPGGSWSPKHCSQLEKLLVVIPYRDRERHLKVLLGHLHALLQTQLITYTVYVVEQYGSGTFNKGRIMDAAFREATSQQHFDCVMFHDVDLIPEDDRIPYWCPEKPRHLSVAVDLLGYRLMYGRLIGGVLVMRTEHFIKTNGYSLSYWGWGGEDDDMADRLDAAGLGWIRPDGSIARYKMFPHDQSARNPRRHALLANSTRRMSSDGLTSLNYYHVFACDKKPLFTHLLVDVGTP